jgi:hypothetical protein
MKNFWFSIANGKNIIMRVYFRSEYSEELPAILQKMTDLLSSGSRNDINDLWDFKREFPEESTMLKIIYDLLRHRKIKTVTRLPWLDTSGHSISIEFD